MLLFGSANSLSFSIPPSYRFCRHLDCSEFFIRSSTALPGNIPVVILVTFESVLFDSWLVDNYLNSSDHRVVASYSGLHEECEVNISMCLA